MLNDVQGYDILLLSLGIRDKYEGNVVNKIIVWNQPFEYARFLNMLNWIKWLYDVNKLFEQIL